MKSSKELKTQIIEFTKELENYTNENKQRVAIEKKIKKLREELLFVNYMELQSKEMREEVLNYRSFKQPGKDICIRVNFANGEWLRVYRTGTGLEWY